MGYNCSFATRTAEVEPYGDIAGPGVIAGFLGTAWLAVIFVSLHYFFVFDPFENPFQSRDGNASCEIGDPWRVNPIDSLAKAIVKNGLRRMYVESNWAGGLEMSILGMCDLQFVTGFGILISGFIDLPRGISAYHFLLVTHLAWFSNLTHICGLTVLRKYFHTRPLEKSIRIICMAILAIMLLVAMGPTLLFNWANAEREGTASLAGTDAICFYNLSRSIDWLQSEEHSYDLTGTTAFGSGMISAILLILTLVNRIIKFHYSLSKPFKKIRNYVGAKNMKHIIILADRGTEVSGIRVIAVRRALLYSQVASFLTVQLYCDLGISALSDVYWLLVSATWGTMKFFITKFSAKVDENDWTFGQVLPAFLVIGPIATAVKGALDGQCGRLPSSATDATVSIVQSVPEDNGMIIHSSDHLEESLDMRRFRQHLFNCLERNYYDTSTCSWMIPLLIFMCIQILEVTVLMLFQLALSGSNAVIALLSVFFPIFMVFPTATYVLIFACLLFEHLVTDNKKHVIRFSATMSIVVLGLYSMLPIWGNLVSSVPIGNLPYSTDVGSIGASMYLFLTILLGYLAPKWLFRKVPDHD